MDISIIIPLYKGQKYINTLVDMIERNILFQELYKKCSVEVILVNDYPEEKIIVNEIILFDVHILYQKQNMGIQDSRIKGIKYAKGTYIIMLDQDDLVEDNWLFSQWNTIRKEAGTYCVCNGWNNRFKKLWRIENFVNQVNNVQYFLSQRNPIRSPGQVIIKREAIPEAWMNNVLWKNGADDFLLWILALKEGNKFIINKDMLFYHTPDRTSDSISSEKMIDSLKETLSILRMLNCLTEDEREAFERQIFRIACCFEDSKKDIMLGIEGKDVLKVAEYKRVRDISDIYHLWLQTKNQGLKIVEYLKLCKINSIAIYGMGMLGVDLYEELKKGGVNVIYAIDQAAVDFKKELKIYQIEETFEEADITIITIVGYEKQLIDIIQKKTGGKAISFKELLIRMASNEKCC